MTSTKDVYVKTALFGLGLYFVAMLVIMVAILIASPGDVYFILFFAVPGLIVGSALLYLRRWGLIAGILGGGFGTLVALEDIDLFLTTPQSFFDFSSSLFALTGVLTVLIASLVGTVQHFRGKVGAGPGRLHPVLPTVATVLVAAASVSALLTAFNTGDVSAADAEGTIVVTAKKAKWDVAIIEAPPGQTIRILVKNKDSIMHTFTIHDLGIDERLGPWTETLIEVEVPDARIYGFICRIEGHKADMTGAIDAR